MLARGAAMIFTNFFKHLVKPTTMIFWRAARKRPGGSFKESAHGLFYLKWPELYIKVGLGRGRLGRMLREPARIIGKALGLWDGSLGRAFADTYHGKVMPLKEATDLIKIDRPVRLEVPEKVLPYSQARGIILENPDDLVLLRCPCRATMQNPCEPLDVCIIVGMPVAALVLEHHPNKAKKITADEAAQIVRQEQERGHVSHAFFKEAVLGGFYAICNCCSCCCGAMQATREGTPMLASSGYVAVCAEDACVGCGVCVLRCPFDAIELRKDGQGSVALINAAVCMGCGICTLHCPKQALSLCPGLAKPWPLRVDEFEKHKTG